MAIARVGDQRRVPPRLLLILCCVGFIISAVETALAFKLEAEYVFNHYDVLFDADPKPQLSAFADGKPNDNRIQTWLPNSLHPLLPYTTAPFLRVLGKASSVASHGHWTSAQARRAMALLVSPLCSGLAAMALGIALYWLGLPPWVAISSAVLRGVTFSSVIFGAVPDHLAMGGLANTLLLAWLAYWLVQAGPISRRGYLVWAAIAVFATGVTITQAASAGIVLLVANARRLTAVRNISSSVALAVSVLAGVVLCGAALGRLFGLPAIDNSTVGPYHSYLEAFVSFDPAQVAIKSARIAAQFFQTVISIGVDRITPRYAVRGPDNLVLPPLREWSLGRAATMVSVLAVFGAGVFASFRSKAWGPVQSFAAACLLIIAQNAVLHSFFGDEPFLFSEHWLSPTVFFLALAPMCLGAARPLMLQAVLAGALVLAIAVPNIHRTSQTIAAATSLMADFEVKRALAPWEFEPK